jgi:F-type H+-transporting ATPase subunit gamma
VTLDTERAESRLRNIRKVKPILAALRTISLGSWQMARNRRSAPQQYADYLAQLLPVVFSRLPRRHLYLHARWGAGSDRGQDSTAGRAAHVALVVIGSERGLCGRYNRVLVDRLSEALRDEYAGVRVDVLATGTRMIRDLRVAGHELAFAQGRSLTTMPAYGAASASVCEWLRGYERHELDAVHVLYNMDRGAGTYGPTIARLIPAALPGTSGARAVGHAAESGVSGALSRSVIVETAPMDLYARIVEQWTATEYYRILLEATSTEHSARFQLMELATQNADDISEELVLVVQSARRQSITREMQELAVGAGLLQSRPQ